MKRIEAPGTATQNPIPIIMLCNYVNGGEKSVFNSIGAMQANAAPDKGTEKE